MNRITIIRLEHVDSGKGPYHHCAQEGIEWHRKDHNTEDTPPPQFDPELKHWWNSISYSSSADYVFGFKTREMFDRWFHEKEVEILTSRLGFQIVMYSVEETYVKSSSVQTIFDKTKAMRVA